MKRIYLIYMAALLLLAACQQSIDTDQPPLVRYGEDVCDRCNMIITDARFAAAYWTMDGVAHRFDDIGEMLAFYHENGDEAASIWVHDVNTGDWLAAAEAYFVLDPALETPMGFGIAATADETTANRLAQDHANVMVLDFPTLLAQVQSNTITLNPGQQHPGTDDMHDMSPNDKPNSTMHPVDGHGE